ncbi:hypothetical protein C8Q77DRAFT_637334 [Trametes polyzona]|nr:hypothetical protein C8Q77DRAFT_637334 [Trametes polyzona]
MRCNTPDAATPPELHRRVHYLPRSESGLETLSVIKPSVPATLKLGRPPLYYIPPRSTSPSASPVANLDYTIGAFSIGTFLSLILYGICALQLYRYVRLYPTENVFIKALVMVVM